MLVHMGVTADAWVSAGAVLVTGMCGTALAGMRSWARRVETKIDLQSDKLSSRVDLVSTAVDKVDDNLSRVKERLTAAETSLRFVTGMLVTGSPPWRHNRRDDPGRELYDPVPDE